MCKVLVPASDVDGPLVGEEYPWPIASFLHVDGALVDGVVVVDALRVLQRSLKEREHVSLMGFFLRGSGDTLRCWYCCRYPFLKWSVYYDGLMSLAYDFDLLISYKK